MENAVKTRLQALQFAPPQTYKNITVVPLVTAQDGATQYSTLGEALTASTLTITEVSTSGSVPELLVTTSGNQFVLLIDGEELAGAKQNRVLNTSILLKPATRTKIPVSCTEQGRWAYQSAAFSESGHVMAFKTRSRKSSSVLRSLESSGAHTSDQGEVWDGIAELHCKLGTNSPTSAMKDAFAAREEDLRKCDETFAAVPRQVGILVFINGNPAGLDLVSLTSAYGRLHQKLVRSYTLEALSEPETAASSGTGSPATKSPDPDIPNITARAKEFLDEIVTAEERRFDSVGDGTDFRYRSPAPQTAAAQQKSRALSGSALVHDNEVIHAAFFRIDETQPPAHMAPLRARRRWVE